MSAQPCSTSADRLAGVCRACGTWPLTASICANCGSSHILRHPELESLAIVHLDCDAFYAAVEKRDNPALAALPVIVGGGRRGVVATCCYVARQYGVRSAMPMFKALQLCPDAVVIKPDMAKYKAVSRALRERLDALTPVIEPLSIDEAFLDMRGTQQLHGAPVAVVMARLMRRIEQELGITVSVGISINKFLAKLASDMDKPRGLTLIGGAEAAQRLADLPVSRLWGVGPAAERRLVKLGYRRFSDLADASSRSLLADLGPDGLRLAALARGEDQRRISSTHKRKSISAETTFNEDIAEPEALLAAARRAAGRVASGLRAQGLYASSVTLKLKTADFRLRTRSHSFIRPRQTAKALIEAIVPLLQAEASGTSFRLLGIGVAVCPPPVREATLDFDQDNDTGEDRQRKLEAAIDTLKARFGKAILG